MNLSDYRMVLYALALIIMMIVRPEGLFGVREIWDYPRGILAQAARRSGERTDAAHPFWKFATSPSPSAD